MNANPLDKIRPIPDGHGVGFCSMEQLAEMTVGYKEQQAGRYWNYLVTPDCWDWPAQPPKPKQLVIDGFSPNLNKELHVGHLRNLALANSLSDILNAKMVALLGASLGIKEEAEAKLLEWFDFLGYKPEIYYDTKLPDCVEFRTETDSTSHELGCGVWDGPKGPVIVVRSDGRKTYAYHDLAFAKTVTPTHYITGAEQSQHFASLGLGDKHLPMGLVLGKTENGWGKLKSRTGDAMSAEEMMQEIVSYLKQGNLQKTKEPLSDGDYRKLAWNIVAWNLLHVARTKDVKFEPEKWTRPDEPGLYISYTYARVFHALSAGGSINLKPALTQVDADLMGYSSYLKFYYGRAVETFEAAPIANFAHDLARKLSAAYESERIVGGREAFWHSMQWSVNTLGYCMNLLGMFKLMRV